MRAAAGGSKMGHPRHAYFYQWGLQGVVQQDNTGPYGAQQRIAEPRPCSRLWPLLHALLNLLGRGHPDPTPHP